MAIHDDHGEEKRDTGYGASEQGDLERAPDQVQPEHREPPPDEEVEQDNYANTDDATS